MGSYCAQLFDGGILTGTKSIKKNTESKSATFNGDALVAKAGFGGQEALEESLEHQFDAGWSLPLNVLDRLDELDFLHRDLDSIQIGQLLLTKGSITVIDIKMLKSLWRPISLAITSEGKATHANKKDKEQAKKRMELVGSVLDQLPPTVQMFFEAGRNIIWSSLSADQMIINPDDLALKYGGKVDGEWHMLSVLDAKPDQAVFSSLPTFVLEHQFLCGIAEIIENMRKWVGRPGYAYGATPIAIFRALKPANQS
ncbi:hypothetical protein SAMN02949497_1198 [Methylomagnum ishizawai]|uniref:Uncharacterized protein n=1 Tax=Methylomagnum ishizawai TaxID=1760988 RepID=A0A1Y6D012_9GAMM|nr:hypothetical protein [Methylomagnum ishizawai]SMF93902.1 hypothetical protein SAMN02949497_1198 [Methylomagnum ishizawai]